MASEMSGLTPHEWLELMQKQLVSVTDYAGNQKIGSVSMSQSNEFSWSLESLIDSVQGVLFGASQGSFEADNVVFESVSTDSRTLKAGALYIALVGEHFDGHDFIEAAVVQGAVAVLVSNVAKTHNAVVPTVLVEDTRVALGQFARWHRLQMPLKHCIAITGSNGKTTTKTWLQNIFSQVGHTLATEGNLNNDYGVPRTLLNLRPEHEFAIIEMGANHPGEIAYLTQLALPDIALLTNASAAHLEGFGSVQKVIETKGGIFLGLNQRSKWLEPSLRANVTPGVAVINTDSMGYSDWKVLLKEQKVQTVCQFGYAEQADIQVLEAQSCAQGVQVSLRFNHQQHSPVITMLLPVLGVHNAMNAAACVAVALNAGLSWAQIQPGLVNFTGVAGRLQKQTLTWPNGVSLEIIDDSYNANPASVKAGIDTLVSQPGLVILCLGAMGELGEQAKAAHHDVAQYAKQKGVDYLFVLGDLARDMPMAFGKNGQWFAHHAEMLVALQNTLQALSPLDTVSLLVKGSRSAQMEKIVQGLLIQVSLV
jgi:UDP-N-acetylmuramoyl-tripeptide--D-alanyl-D-alanine ligase